MFCNNCGKEIDDKAVVCPHCGVAQKALEQTEKKPVNGLGIAGFVLSLLSLWLSVYFCIASIIGLVLSAIGYAKREKHSLNGLALAGLIISIVTLVIWGIVWLAVGSVIIGM